MNIKNKKEHYLQQIKYYQDKLKELQIIVLILIQLKKIFHGGLFHHIKLKYVKIVEK